jgi:hypothetical protein
MFSRPLNEEISFQDNWLHAPQNPKQQTKVDELFESHEVIESHGLFTLPNDRYSLELNPQQQYNPHFTHIMENEQ